MPKTVDFLRKFYMVTRGSVYEIIEDSEQVHVKKIEGSDSGLNPGNCISNNYLLIVPKRGFFVQENFDPNEQDPFKRLDWNYKSSAICAIVNTLEKALEIHKQQDKEALDEKYQLLTQKNLDSFSKSINSKIKYINI